MEGIGRLEKEALMKRTLRILLLVALAALMLTVSALADMAPSHF